MPRVKLAHWHDGHAPGDEIDVTDDEATALMRDGRISEVLVTPTVPPVPPAEAVSEQEDDVESAPQIGRRKR